MKRRTNWLVLIALVVIAVVLAACGGSDSGSNSANESGGKKAGKDLTIAVNQNFVTLDPQDSNNTLDNSVQQTMLEGLVGFDKDMKIIPKLAENYKVNKDATEFTFMLRKDVTFHDGEAFNAEAVKTNFERVSDEKNGLKRYSLFSNIEKIDVVDDYTVKFTLKNSFASMINNFAHPAGAIQSPKSLASGDDVSRKPVGTGPYVFESWDSSDIIKVKKNDKYWNGDVAANSITFKPVVENGSRTAMLQTGEADFAYPIPTEQVETLKKQNITIENTDSIVMNYLSMNVSKEPFNDPKVREAITHAINKEDLIKVVYADYAKPATSVIAEKTQFYSKQEDQSYDVEKAKALMKEAGKESGFETTIWATNTTNYIKAMEFIQQSLAEINIKVKVEPMENGALADALWAVEDPKDAKVQMYFGGWSPSTGEADWAMRPLFSSDSFPPNSYNISYYSSKEVDKGLKEGLATSDEGERQKIYDDVQKTIWTDMPWVPISNPDNIFGKKSNLEGIVLLPDGGLSVTELQIK